MMMMMEYDQHYDFELQLLVESFCRRVVVHAELAAQQALGDNTNHHHDLVDDSSDAEEEEREGEEEEVGDEQIPVTASQTTAGPEAAAGSASSKYLSPNEIPLCLEAADQFARAIWQQQQTKESFQ